MPRIALIQTTAGPDPASNRDRHAGLVRRAAGAGAQIVLLQELYDTEYFCHTYDETHFDWAQPADGASVAALQPLAAEFGIVIVVPYFERRAPGLYHNSAAVIDADGSIAGRYRKMHIPDDPGFQEKYYFTPGDLGYQAIATRYGRIGVLICWDQWFPEAARLTALQGADLLVYPTAIGVLEHETADQEARFRDAWETIQRSHAVANGIHVAAINRVGVEHGTRFWGGSFLADPFGAWVARAGSDEQILLADADFGATEPQRRQWPFLRDRRIDSYAGLLKRFGSE